MGSPREQHSTPSPALDSLQCPENIRLPTVGILPSFPAGAVIGSAHPGACGCVPGIVLFWKCTYLFSMHL